MPNADADHNKLIAAAAKEVLAPLGLVRKGRSRTWLDDHGWWIGIVEFQASDWAKGTYLNVGAMFLWRPAGQFVFEVGHRVGEFSSAEQGDFPGAAMSKARGAADRVTELRDQLASISNAAAYSGRRQRQLTLLERGHLATAHGLLGHTRRSRRNWDLALALRERESPNRWNATAWMLEAREAAGDQGTFTAWVERTTRDTRLALKLPRLDHPVTGS